MHCTCMHAHTGTQAYMHACTHTIHPYIHGAYMQGVFCSYLPCSECFLKFLSDVHTHETCTCKGLVSSQSVLCFLETSLMVAIYGRRFAVVVVGDPCSIALYGVHAQLPSPWTVPGIGQMASQRGDKLKGAGEG